MVTTVQPVRTNPRLRGGTTGALATPRQGQRKSGDLPAQSRQLEIIQQLQTTLNVDKLIRIFDREAKTQVPHSGVAFVNKQHELDIHHGHRANHSCQYQLVIGNEDLGEITFMRRQRFSDGEIARLENFLCLLVYPLRNALQYHDAVLSSFTDPLTGACNRAAMQTAFQRELNLARRQQTPLSVIILDIDHFKKINDRYGHSNGDCVLRSVSQCVGHTIRSSDMLFRYGGEEFVVLLSNTSRAGAKLLAERIRVAVEDLTCECEKSKIHPSISLGVATLTETEDTLGLFARADEALYCAKREGRNRVAVAK